MEKVEGRIKTDEQKVLSRYSVFKNSIEDHKNTSKLKKTSNCNTCSGCYGCTSCSGCGG